MGKRRAKHPFEDNPFIDGCLEWMDAPRGTTVDRGTSIWCSPSALEHAGVDARQRKIVWADGKRLSIEHSTDRIHTEHPDVPRHLIETHLQGWLENCAPVILLRTPTRGTRPASSDPGSTTTSARHEPRESSRELGTLEKFNT